MMPQKDRPDIIAKLQFHNTADGGREGPIYGTNIFKCLFVFDRELYDCGLLLDEQNSICPGQTVTVPIRFLVPELLQRRLRPGDKFQLREVRTIADGEVESVLLEQGHREPNTLDDD